MSKKMMKRSLVLGALMAFVITGSAWAAEYNENAIVDGELIPNDHSSNIVTISSDYDFKGGYLYIIGGEGPVVTENVVNLSGTFEGDGSSKNPVQIYGGDGSTVENNEVNILAGLIGKDCVVVGGVASSIAKNNAVNISGGTVKGNVFGASWSGVGSADVLTFNDNSINISGTANVQEAGLYGYGKNNGRDVEASGNTLNITGWKGSESEAEKGYGTIGSAQNFNVININEGSSVLFKEALSDGNVTVNVKGATWNVDKANTVGSAYFDATSTLKIDGATFAKDTGVYALNGNKEGNLTVVEGAKIVIESGKENETYNVAKNFATNEGKNWTLQADDALWFADWVLGEDGNLQATIGVKEADALVTDNIATNENKEILVNVAGSNIEEGVNPTVDAIKELTSVESNLTSDQQQKAIAAVLQVAEAGGFTGNVVSVGKQVNNTVGARNSFAGPKHGGPRHRGGHGPSVTEEANGSAIWAQYVHGKDKVDGIDMGGTKNAYESQFNGVVLGADFKQVGSYASGIAFNYGEGDSHSKKNVVQSDSEFDFWGVSYYGAVKKQDTNFIFDIGYSESDSDVEQKIGTNTITANPEASTWTAGVKVEKLIDKGAVQIVPYAGLRYMSIDTDDYEAKGGTEATYYSTERQDIWLLPVGVSLSQENVYDSGWIVTPKADFSYTWAMGDTDSSMTVNIPNVASDTLGYTVMDDGSFMATVGLDAQKEDWTFGVAYSYQKGDSTRSDRWYVNARYSF